MDSHPVQTTISDAPVAELQPIFDARRPSEPAVQFEQVALFQWLSQVANDSDSLESLLKGMSEVICCQTDCLGLWVTQQGEDQKFSQMYSLLSEPGGVEWDSFHILGRKMIKLALGSRQIQSCPLPDISTHQLIIAPVIEGLHVETMIAGCFHLGPDGGAGNQWLMGIFGQAIANWLSLTKFAKSETRSRSLNDVVGLTKELDRSENIETASVILVNQLKRLTQARQVAFAAATARNLPKLMAISDIELVDHNSTGVKATSQACGQALTAKQILSYPDKGSDPSDILALEKYCKSNGFDACLSVPLITENDQLMGAVLLAVTPKQASDKSYHQYLEQMAQMVSGHLNVVLKANQSLKEHAKALVKEKVTGRQARIALSIMGFLLATMMMPWPYRVPCECEIRPVQRRFIAAPYDGVLEKNLVTNGEMIEQGQIVAHLDGRQLRIEKAGLEAELKGASKRRAAAIASGAIADGQIALSEVKKLQSQIDLVNDQLDNLDIRSPIDGIVVAGDLEKVEGAPVEMGQTLFEVGPLDRMLAEIAIPEQEIPYVRPGMTISIKLNAYPFETWQGTIEKIHPKSEIKDQNSVFIAEVNLENKELNLKPGMKGHAKITSSAYPLVWNFFHRPLEQIRYWTIW